LNATSPQADVLTEAVRSRTFRGIVGLNPETMRRPVSIVLAGWREAAQTKRRSPLHAGFAFALWIYPAQNNEAGSV
jgi:hypothetical protein